MAGVPDLSWFVPGETQLNFINDFSKETVYAGGVGSGKTLSGAFKAVIVSHLYPGTVGLVGRQSYRALEDTTKKVIVYGDDKPPVLHPDLVDHKSEEENHWWLKCGSEILFRSLEDHNIEKLLSLNLGWVYVDELTESSLKVWLTLLGRLRHPVGPRIAWGTTNPNGHDWVWQRFHKDSGQAVGRLYHQPTEANAKHLPPDYIAQLRSMPKEWQKRFVDASFDTAAGMIWDMWQREIHVYDADQVGHLPPSWKRFESMDHGRRNPTAWLWWVVDADGNLIVEDEYYEADRVPSEHAVAVAAKREFVSPGIRYGAVIAPPDCFRAPPMGNTIAAEYQDAAGIVMTPANDNVEAGLLRVAEWLNRDPEHPFPDWHPWRGTPGPDGRGAPRLFVSSRCVNLIREIPEYRWRDLSPSQEEKADQPEEPRKKDDHACDALRYGVMARARPYVSRPAPIERVRSRPQDRRAVTAGLIDREF